MSCAEGGARAATLGTFGGAGGAQIPTWLLEEVSLLQFSPAEPPWPASGVEMHSLRWSDGSVPQPSTLGSRCPLAEQVSRAHCPRDLPSGGARAVC